jgi:hypothetical protein
MDNLVKEFLKEFNLKKGSISWKSLDKSSKLSTYRKNIVFGLLKDVMKDVECQEKCKSISVGSNSIYSDLDITITGKKAIQITKEFDKKFREMLGGSPEKVFDTNLYATSFIFEPYQPNYSVVKSKDKILYFIDNKGKDVYDQRLFAITKIIENADPVQMKIVEQQLSRKILKDSFERLRDLKNDDRSYIKELEHIKSVQAEFEETEINKLKLGIELKHSISRANYKSNDAYVSQGAFFHVVGKLQSNYKNLPITKEEYIDSVIENTGFLIENWNKYKLIKSKYLDRIKDAFKNIKIKFNLPTKKSTDIIIILNSVLSKIPFVS